MASPSSRDDVLERTDTVRSEKRTPPCRVLLINDDYTPMDFVIDVLVEVFGKSEDEAKILTLKVHVEGSAVAGIYPFEIAETKVEEVHDLARAAGHPLKAVVDEGEA